MNLLSRNKNTFTVRFFDSVEDISPSIFEDLQCTANLYFNPLYLKAIEKHNTKIHFAYLVLFDSLHKPIGLCSIQVFDFQTKHLTNSIHSVRSWLEYIGQKWNVLNSKKAVTIATCGNSFVSGEHGIYLHPEYDKKTLLKQVADGLVHYSLEKKKLHKTIDAFVVKDFVKESIKASNSLLNMGYTSFQAEPNMVLQLPDSWQNFDQYLDAMKTKFRVKAKRALQKSSALSVIDFSMEKIEQFLPEMTTMYQNISKNATFNLVNFNLETYVSLKENLGDRYFLNGYFLEGKLVGFASGLVNGKTLDAHFVGINYSLNKEYSIYQRMLYDYVSIGISKKVKSINFGRTASEIKSSVGAIPEKMTIYLRHRKSIPNKIVSLLVKNIKPTDFSQKSPFKTNALKK
ncbi:GNAT family N-acetyltransferase [Tenacibaculum sp. SG-28]|uniref:GNAT family N-acetyltransferase n=1 Tax=Tenacibaculum sp. SG-28 TaxID=754426 RepID=UPI000CF4222E|nr:GNAT family N-acetyltransferase [Tenacibaculum sp. SG-28]PQJ21722.1 hypothetical protein BSU00_06480 [Tenacibaculum sp. SG-28]